MISKIIYTISFNCCFVLGFAQTITPDCLDQNGSISIRNYTGTYTGITIEKKTGLLWVCCVNDKRIVKINKQGKIVHTIQYPAPDQINYIYRGSNLFSLSENELWITGERNGIVYKLDPIKGSTMQAINVLKQNSNKYLRISGVAGNRTNVWVAATIMNEETHLYKIARNTTKVIDSIIVKDQTFLGIEKIDNRRLICVNNDSELVLFNFKKKEIEGIVKLCFDFPIDISSDKRNVYISDRGKNWRNNDNDKAIWIINRKELLRLFSLQNKFIKRV